MMTGTVGFYYDDKGYGFIETDELERSVFAHITKVIEPNPPALC
jgi:cold shock CspA family protein